MLVSSLSASINGRQEAYKLQVYRPLDVNYTLKQVEVKLTQFQPIEKTVTCPTCQKSKSSKKIQTRVKRVSKDCYSTQKQPFVSRAQPRFRVCQEWPRSKQMPSILAEASLLNGDGRLKYQCVEAASTGRRSCFGAFSPGAMSQMMMHAALRPEPPGESSDQKAFVVKRRSLINAEADHHAYHGCPLHVHHQPSPERNFSNPTEPTI